MKNIILCVFLLLGSSNKKVLSRRLQATAQDNVITNAESEFSKSYLIRTRGIPEHYARNFEDYDSEEEYNDSGHLIFPNSGWGAHTSSSSSHSHHIRQCVTTCERGSYYQPVCGTDGVTYSNVDQLECFKKCGINVEIRQLSSCSVEPVSTNIPIVRKPSDKELQSCISSCPTTPEYNPVCGTDNVTYNNHGKLICAQTCGKDVQLGRHSPCPKIAPPTEDPDFTTSTTPRGTTISSTVLTCIRSCPTTSEYNPVCGSNSQTYYNLSKLKCASYCGVDVSLQKSVPCHLEVTEPNIVTEFTSKVTTTTQKSLPDHTIPQDLIDSIFNNKKDKINYDIDIRFPE